MRTNPQPEIATTGVRTGLAMTKKVASPCHCEERSDAAIPCRNYGLHTTPFVPTVRRRRIHYSLFSIHCPLLSPSQEREIDI